MAFHPVSFPPPGPPCFRRESNPARSSTVFDGDTFDITVDGQTTRYRLYRADTPETYDPLECGGNEATAFVRAALAQSDTPGKIWIEDVGQLDLYGRTLAYLWFTIDGQPYLLNHLLINSGWAENISYGDAFDPYRSELGAAASYAYANRLGVWGTCGDFGVPLTAALAAPTRPAGESSHPGRLRSFRLQLPSELLSRAYRSPRSVSIAGIWSSGTRSIGCDILAPGILASPTGCRDSSWIPESGLRINRTIPTMTTYPQHILIFDGDCDFCQEWAGWLALRDANQRKFRICPWKVVPSPPMTPLLMVQAQKAVQLVTTDGRQLSGGRAVLFALRETNWHPHLIRLLEHRPFVWAIDAGYRIVAANRPHFARFTPH